MAFEISILAKLGILIFQLLKLLLTYRDQCFNQKQKLFMELNSAKTEFMKKLFKIGIIKKAEVIEKVTEK